MRALRTFVPSVPTATRSLPPGIAAGLPLLGLSKERPSIGQSGSPLREPPRGRSVGTRRPGRVRVPSSWFCTTSTGSSSLTSRACCIPLPILGFTAFRSVAKRTSSRCTMPCGAFLPDGSLDTSPPPLSRVDAFTAPRSLLAFRLPQPSWAVSRLDRAGGAGPPGPCSTVGSGARPTVAGGPGPLLPWAWTSLPNRSPKGAPRRLVPNVKDHSEK